MEGDARFERETAEIIWQDAPSEPIYIVSVAADRLPHQCTPDHVVELMRSIAVPSGGASGPEEMRRAVEDVMSRHFEASATATLVDPKTTATIEIEVDVA